MPDAGRAGLILWGMLVRRSATHPQTFFNKLDDLLGVGSIFKLGHLQDLEVQVFVDDHS